MSSFHMLPYVPNPIPCMICELCFLSYMDVYRCMYCTYLIFFNVTGCFGISPYRNFSSIAKVFCGIEVLYFI